MSKFIPVEASKWADMVKAQSDVEHLRRDAVHSANFIGGLQEENARLKAEVERLRKAGDAMACHLVCSDLPDQICGSLNKAWLAAKEGKPSV